MKIAEILNELTVPSYKGDAGELLYSLGYQPLGSGAFGAVYGKPDAPYVLKVFDPEDGYLHFLKLVMSVSNPHFPVVRGKPMRITDAYWGVRLERLEPVEHFNEDLAKACRRYCHLYKDLSDTEQWRYDRPQDAPKMGSLDIQRQMSYDEMANFEKYYPELAEALQLVVKRVLIPNNSLGDLHVGNFMQRGTVLVITDPLAYVERDTLPGRSSDFAPAGTTRRQAELPLGDDLGYRPDYRKLSQYLPPGVRMPASAPPRPGGTWQSSMDFAPGRNLRARDVW